MIGNNYEDSSRRDKKLKHELKRSMVMDSIEGKNHLLKNLKTKKVYQKHSNGGTQIIAKGITTPSGLTERGAKSARNNYSIASSTYRTKLMT
jgi:hypothetical protein